MRWSLMHWLPPCAFAAVLLYSGCPQDESLTAKYPVLVRAVDDSGKPLASVQLSVAGVALGETDGSGQRAFSLPGMEGQRVDLVAQCPEHYTGPRERPAFLLKRMRNPQGGSSDQPIEVKLTCDATEHVALVAIHTDQAGLPILLRGQVVAQTSDTGTAHVMLREPAGKSFQLTLDTAGKPRLRPESPSHMFTVTHQDAFSVWDQPFELERRRGRRSRRRRRQHAAAAAPPAPGPTRAAEQ